jgi:hypothetical protein
MERFMRSLRNGFLTLRTILLSPAEFASKTFCLLGRSAKARLALTCAIGFVASANAGTAIGVSGVVSSIALISNLEGAPGNYDLRVALASGAISGCNAGFLYVNLSDANYNAIAAYMINAKNTGATIIFTYFVDSNGFCHIGDLAG